MKKIMIALVLFLCAGGVHAGAEEVKPYLIYSSEEDVELLKARYPAAAAFEVLPVIELELTSSQKEAIQTTYPKADVHPVLTYETAADTVPSQFSQIVTRPADTAPYTGKGVKVAVIDTGIDVDHPELKVAGGVCTMQVGCDTTKPYDDDDEIHGHGTHVAGILAAQKNDAGIIGIAPDIELYAIKALNSVGGGTTTEIMAGVEWAIQHDMDIINMSISIGEDDPLLKLMLQKAYEEGLLLVSAAGNEGYTDNSVTYPGKYPTVIAVSAVKADNTLFVQSSTGAEVEFTAPGDNIYSTTPKELDGDGKADGYRVLSGTSMAAPHVSGILALYKERFPSYSNEQLRALLQTNVKDLGAEGRDPKFGYGLAVYKQELAAIPNVIHEVINGKIVVSLKTADATNRILQLDGQTVKEVSPGRWELFRLAGTYSAVVKYKTAAGEQRQEAFTVNVPEPKFKDIGKANWYAPQVAYLTHYGWIYGYADNSFQPSREILRSEAVAMLGRAYGLNGEQRTTRFTDVGKQNFASGFIQSAYEEGLLSGFPDGSFRPDQPVTRAEMAILLSKAYKLTYDSAKTNPFPDVSTSMAAFEEIQMLVQAGVTEGFSDGTYRPDAKMTRSTFSVFLAKIDRPELFN